MTNLRIRYDLKRSTYEELDKQLDQAKPCSLCTTNAEVINADLLAFIRS
jgi:hypothetical protein